MQTVMAASVAMEGVLFRDVILEATGHKVLPTTSGDKIDGEIIDHISQAAEHLIQWLNQGDSPTVGLRRINEASRAVEDKLFKLLNTNGFACTLPPTAAGAAQRSGYPDLRLEHLASHRVTYLDPKLLEATARSSTLRTFYYEPKEATGKVREDAHHLLLGISHDGKDGAWKFTGWDLVDLHDFRVRLKAEFQGSNRDLYREDLLLLRRSPSR